MSIQHVYVYTIDLQRVTFIVSTELTYEQAWKIANVLADGDKVSDVHRCGTLQNGEYVSDFT